MHRHYCDVAGHEYECSNDCECFCGLPMEGHDHSDCPIELRACAEHAEQNGSTTEVVPGAVQIDLSVLSPERQQSVPHCECGCADLALGASVGFCLWCDHVYSEWSPVIQDRHFAWHCPGAPEQSRQDARASFVRH